VLTLILICTFRARNILRKTAPAVCSVKGIL
jgi:hypothetical protein